MARTTYLPTVEADLVAFSNNFNAQINADPTAVGLSLPQAAAYTVLHDAFVASWTLLQNPDNRTKPNTTAKNQAKTALIDGDNGIRQLVDIIQAYPGTTDVQRNQLQITVRDAEPTPSPLPSAPPQVTITKVEGRVVTIRLRDIANPSNRKPEKVKGATVFSYVGDTAPDDLDEFSFEANTGDTDDVQVTFASTVPEGSKVWVTASWFNPRTQNGPAAEPIYTFLNNGQMSQAA